MDSEEVNTSFARPLVSGSDFRQRWQLSGLLKLPWVREDQMELCWIHSNMIGGIAAITLWGLAIAVLFGRLNHLANLVVVSFMSLFSAASMLLVTDRLLFRAIFRRFEGMYFVGNAGLMLVSVAVSASSTGSTLFLWSYISVSTSILTVILLLDAMPTISRPVRVCFLLLVLFIWAYTAISDMAGDPLIPASNMCLYFCADTRRWAYVGMVQILFLTLKYLVNVLKWTAPHFNILQLPVGWRYTRSRQSQHSVNGNDMHPKSNVIESHSDHDPQVPGSQASHSVESAAAPTAASEREPPSYDRIRLEVIFAPDFFDKSATALAGLQHILVREYAFKPLLDWSLLLRVAQSRFYPFLPIALFAAGLGLSATLATDSSGQYDSLLLYLAVFLSPLVAFMILAFATFYDRLLVRSLARRFELCLLCGSFLQFLIFYTWITDDALNRSWNWATTMWYLPISICIAAMDGAVSCRYWFQTAIFMGAFANAARQFIFGGTSSDLTDDRVCIFVCSSTKSLAFSALFTVVILYCKFLVQLLLMRHRRRVFVAVKVHITFSVALKNSAELMEMPTRTRAGRHNSMTMTW